MTDRQTDRAPLAMLYHNQSYYWENIIKSNHKLMTSALRLYISKDKLVLMTQKR